MSVLILVVVLYCLPTLLAILMQSPRLVSVSIFNLFLGWTIVGWLLALLWVIIPPPRAR